jgi:predicted transcriptional regulator
MAKYVRGSDTSEAAAMSLQSILPSMSAQVLETLEEAGSHGATCDEVEVELGMRHQTASARIKGLVDNGLAVDSGMRRRTRSGRKATVWLASSV